MGSMNQLVTTAIVLARTNYGEADRILTVLTPEYGKLRLMAKGVRRVKSKLAGGIELFSTSNITFIRGRGEIGTLISARLLQYYDHIVRDITRVLLGYEMIKMLNKAIEDEAEPMYFELLEQAYQALDDDGIDEDLIRAWFAAQLLKLGGHTPNLRTDITGKALLPDQVYEFDFTSVAFTPKERGQFTTDHIKYLRLIFSGNQPRTLRQVNSNQTLLPGCTILINTMLNTFVRI
jgi:DNA repair protein RecO